MTKGHSNVLVTGASGLVGAEVVARLADAGHAVTALVHTAHELKRNNGRRIRTVTADPAPGEVTCVPGDVTRPGLGLPDDVRSGLCAEIDLIVHCAAATDFGRPAELYERVNVDGTAHVVGLARAGTRGPTPLTHVSTAYVCGERDGTVLEDELDVGQRFGNAYERSKFEAEVMLRREMAAGLRVAIVRPSIVVGAERSGVTREFKNIYVVLKVLTRGLVRSIPGHYDATLDLVPIDYVASLIAEVADRFDQAEGRTFHAIGATPLNLRDLSDVLAEYPPFHVPDFVPPALWRIDQLAPLERRYYQSIISLYQSYSLRRTRFSSEEAAKFASCRPTVQAKTHLRRMLDHCLRVGYLGGPAPETASNRMRIGPKIPARDFDSEYR